MEYQPQVNVSTQQIVSAEALIRWRHPKLGLIPAGEFIPVAEEVDLIGQIGEFVLMTVCKQIKSWEDQGKQLVPIGINVSASELSKQDFAENFSSILSYWRVKPSLINIEITETALIRNEDYAHDTIRKLRNLGMKIHVDDFGRGYNSLGMLKGIAVDGLKIDRMFVSNIHRDLGDRAIVSAIVNLAHAHHWEVIAEGVECEDSLSVLTEEHCDLYQGFLFSRPTSPEEFAQRLAALSQTPARETAS